MLKLDLLKPFDLYGSPQKSSCCLFSCTTLKTYICPSMVEELEITGALAIVMVNACLMRYLISLIEKLKAVKIWKYESLFISNDASGSLMHV